MFYNLYLYLFYNKKTCSTCNKQFYRRKSCDNYEENVCSLGCFMYLKDID